MADGNRRRARVHPDHAAGPRPRRIAWPVVALALVMVGAGVTSAAQAVVRDRRAAAARRPPPPVTRADSVVAPEQAGTSTAIPGPGPLAYRITYRVRYPGKAAIREVVEVTRPFISRRTSAGDLDRTSFARLLSQPRRGSVTVVSPPPAAIDARPAAVVERAMTAGLLQRREARRVAGRTCRVYRDLSPVSDSTIRRSTPQHHTDICIDERGLVLEEWQVDGGKGTSQRVALEVHEYSDPLPIPEITEHPTLTAAQGGGSVLPVDPTSEPVGRFWVLDSPPEGYALRGRYSVVPPQSGLDDETQRRQAVASTADVFEHGTDVIVVDRGAALNLDKAFQPRAEGLAVDLGPTLGTGELLLSWSGPETRVAFPDGKFVRVYGSVDVDTLLQVARSLRETAGGSGLVFTPPA